MKQKSSIKFLNSLSRFIAMPLLKRYFVDGFLEVIVNDNKFSFGSLEEKSE